MQILRGLFFVLIFTLSACSNSNGNANPRDITPSSFVKNANPGVGTITVVGDSLAAGYGSTDQSVIPARCLAQLPHKQGYDYSVPGRTSDAILREVRSVESTNPQLVFVSSGGNDTMTDLSRPGTYPEAKTMVEVGQMFDRLLNTGAVVIYLGLNPPLNKAQRLPAIAKLASEKGVLVVDGMNGFWTNPNLMSDRIHPNSEGYRIMCERILAAVKPYYP